jgi:RNase P subunit RPR2
MARLWRFAGSGFLSSREGKGQKHVIETRSVDQQATAHMTAFMKHKTCQQCGKRPTARTVSESNGSVACYCRKCADELDHQRAMASRRTRP